MEISDITFDIDNVEDFVSLWGFTFYKKTQDSEYIWQIPGDLIQLYNYGKDWRLTVNTSVFNSGLYPYKESNSNWITLYFSKDVDFGELSEIMLNYCNLLKNRTV